MDNDTATAATMESLRDALDASKAREEAYRADVVRLTATVDALRQNANDADIELAKAMSRADVLAAEVRAWRYQCVQEQCEGGDVDGADCRLNAAMAATDSTNALDPAKFAPEPTLARNQPCGCVVCRCEDDNQCQGCGAKHCGKHEVGKFPEAKFNGGAE
jgi:hypothetical protein